ncbi:MAG TPA: CHAT domain-containing protein, partial [Thermoanaerobaculia bacterium]|nr:CHAT domain-containing protein [Thermoanaerobaculia bacterium]
MVEDLDEVHLRFEKTGGGGWQVAVENASAGTTVRVPLRWPVLSARLAKTWGEVSTARRDLEIGGMPASEALAEIGEAVYQAVVAAEVRGGLRTLLDQANRSGSGLRIWVHAGKAPELERVPWEVFFDRRGVRFLALSERTPVVRYLENEEPLRRQPPGKPLRILLPAARPPDRRRLDVEGELSAIEGALGECVKAGGVVLEPIADVTIEDLLRRLDGGPPCDVVHFIGHAGFDATVRDGALVFEDGSGGSRAVGARHLGPLLLDHEALQLLVLNACEGCKTPFHGTSPGLAQALMQQRVPAVIAMQTPITDAAAVAFARHFYAAVGMGRTVDVALSHCRKAMFLAGHEVEWAAPVLYLRSVQGPLLPACTGPAAAAAQAPAPVRRTVFAATALLVVILACLWFWFRPGQSGRPVAAGGAVSEPRVAIRAAGPAPAVGTAVRSG